MIVAHHRSERHPTDEEDEDKLERRHLLPWAPSYDADHQDEKTVSDNGSENSRHIKHSGSNAVAMYPGISACLQRFSEETRAARS